MGNPGTIDTPDLESVFDSGQGAYLNLTLGTMIDNASGIIVGNNPAYAVSDFFAIYPQFGSFDITQTPPVYTGLIPQPVVVVFINLASACLQQGRYQDSWSFCMALFIAHYCTLYLQTIQNSSPGDAATVYSTGLAKGIAVAKSVGPVSVSYQPLQGFEDWGAWNLTVFGLQLIQLARVIAPGILWVY